MKTQRLDLARKLPDQRSVIEVAAGEVPGLEQEGALIGSAENDPRFQGRHARVLAPGPAG